MTEPQHQPDRHRLTDLFLIVLFGVREFIKRHKAYVPGKWYNNDTTRIRRVVETRSSGWANAERRASFFLGDFEKLGTWTPPAPWQARGAFPFGVAVATHGGRKGAPLHLIKP